MRIECSKCKKRYEIKGKGLPEGKNVSFACKNCGDKIQLSFKKNQLKPEGLQVSPEEEKVLKDKIINKIEDLPPLPQVVLKLQDLIASPDSDVKMIAKVIETEQAMVAKVLKIANSAYYGMRGKISSVQQALVILGNKTLGQIVTTAGTEGTLTKKLPGYGYDSKTLWKHSLAVAFGSKIIADINYPALANEAYTGGLIHDVGKIILDSYILEQKDEIETFMEKEEKTFLDAENNFFVFNHADIASEICRKWNFPEHLIVAIKGHHCPSKSDSNDLQYILHMADYLARLSGTGYDEDDFLYEMAEGTMDYLGLKQENISEIVLKVTDSVVKISSK